MLSIPPNLAGEYSLVIFERSKIMGKVKISNSAELYFEKGPGADQRERMGNTVGYGTYHSNRGMSRESHDKACGQ